MESDNETLTYAVRIPFVGWFEVEVEATSPDEAFVKAYDNQPELSLVERDDVPGEWEYEALPRICEGNVLYASTNEASIYDVTNDAEVDWRPSRGWG